MVTALLFTFAAMATSPGVVTAQDMPQQVELTANDSAEDDTGFFEENWPIALDADLHEEVYEKRLFLWVVAALTWPIAGIVWAPGIILNVDVDEDYSGEAWASWFRQMAPFVCCGPAGGFYATLALIYMGPVRTINLYNRHIIRGDESVAAMFRGTAGRQAQRF